MKDPAEKYLRLTFIGVIAILVALAFVLPLLIGVWVPDVFFDTKHTLAYQELLSGHSFRVIKYWNHGDFYNTELVHTFPDGSKVIDLLDPDDHKTWHATLIVDETFRRATVTLSDHRTKSVRW